MSETKKSGIDYWKQIVVVMSLGWVAIWIYRTVLTPIYPEIQASLDNVSNAEIGAIASFYFFAYCSMQIPCGILVDKFGQKIMLMAGFTLFIIGTLCIAKANGLTMIYIGSLMAGGGCASFFSSAYSLSSANVPQARRALANAIINSGVGYRDGDWLNRFQRISKKHEHGLAKCTVYRGRDISNHAVRLYADHSR
ncbi:Major facilitator family transporter [Salmonella enterica subsp. enterica]|uniref:Major facilitator family transporter n=1 Tax=Salmonella enterica I TaxID=59201 RepID=A0A379V301_SALET|nr:Major facilitator family transporter [Salmonella enterica subsp. enterica]